ncbi:hypothetical protein [Streptococcus himalayensis]|uniref:Uncharacterized protein n=1 Tax=Streptococcus himalayensis TaxID=1888195 RepID=A0A917A455_9STRE|nr:hypothetical protein [Streptococcus himalayensis]GGE25685.1 hypothetical protein GCM10011510_03500 [Streptococcus himalayensis]
MKQKKQGSWFNKRLLLRSVQIMIGWRLLFLMLTGKILSGYAGDITLEMGVLGMLILFVDEWTKGDGQ